MAYLSRRELDEVRPNLEKLVYKVLGTADATIISSIESNLHNGFDRRKLIDKLSFSIDSRKASRLGDKVEDFLDNIKINSQPGHQQQQQQLMRATAEPLGATVKKRPHEPDAKDVSAKFTDPKRMKQKDDGVAVVSGATNGSNGSSGELTIAPPVSNNFSSNQIKMMMENAQREIEERKRKLETIKATKAPQVPASAVAAAVAVSAKISAAAAAAAAAAASATATVLGTAHATNAAPGTATPVTGPAGAAVATITDVERSKKIAQLQEQIRAKLSGTLATVLPPPPPVQDKPKPLILDAEGRTVDGSGRAIIVPQLTPTLKANIRAKKRETSKNQQAAERAQTEESNESHFHDERITLKPAVRNKRALRFHEPGKFQQLAERMRMKAQLEKLQNEISQIARKTGISSATKLALIAPKADTHSNEVPQMEWWDSVILTDDLSTLDAQGQICIRESAITNLIEHPTQMRPPNESSRAVYLPVFLTKKERKKLRRQNRREAWKEEQEKIRLGLEAPPEPKLRISNLMRVLGTEAVQDPTKIEAHVREQMARRQKVHEEANAARKLTDDQRREKKMRKMKEDTTLGVHVAVYRIRELQELQSKKFKVETNAKQLFLTGICVLFRDCCVVVVEGGPKQQKKYRRLMLHRIKWEEDLVKNADGNEIPNTCVLVWEGTNQRRNFGEFKYKSFPLEKSARDFFQKHHVEHYWDLAYSGAVLEASEDA
ncbi:U4/U6 small nuclear ribonucleoprotein Prp3 isoform X1 [Anopheles bellator]|uniref:U4/U6 small nuclear ribonucleoprotein Prp3 isoform X1 n=1 Tax=Anopheles bellator TaxID=139047 RepID=UPI002647DBBB|nr:U4/U6 small nuclear ribonucleoprotein Prp3 isoform X1 [Anopheles bellator]